MLFISVHWSLEYKSRKPHTSSDSESNPIYIQMVMLMNKIYVLLIKLGIWNLDQVSIVHQVENEYHHFPPKSCSAEMVYIASTGNYIQDNQSASFC